MMMMRCEETLACAAYEWTPVYTSPPWNQQGALCS